MVRLLLLRHAKSSWEDLQSADFDRPLNARGRRTLPVIGRYMAREALLPDRILCSSSRRTRETLAGLLPFFSASCEISVTDRLYRGEEETYLPFVAGVTPPVRTLLVIGHNPAIQDTALDAIGDGADDAIAAVREKFPTGALAVIGFEPSDWSAIRPHSGTLEQYIRPRNLENAGAGNGSV